ncbi:MAG: hypothetical protein V7631_4323 [Massilia sp.]|jgi:hypothetical protein
MVQDGSTRDGAQNVIAIHPRRQLATTTLEEVPQWMIY